MNNSENTRLHHIATFLINNRYGIVAFFLVITIGMMFAMSQLRIETGFKKQLPLKHEYMQTFLQYEKEFGGANRVLVALVAREGDMFTPGFFEAFEEILLSSKYAKKYGVRYSGPLLSLLQSSSMLPSDLGKYSSDILTALSAWCRALNHGDYIRALRVSFRIPNQRSLEHAEKRQNEFIKTIMSD